MSALVSVVIPTYNRRDELRYAIDSALAQTVDVEVIVVDDGSDDDTAAVVAAYESVRCVPLPRTRQLGAVRNEGIAHSQGEFVAFLDSDDAWGPSKLARQLETMNMRAGFVAGGTNAFVVRASGSRAADRVYFPDRREDEVISRSTLLAVNPLIVSTVVVRAEALRRVGGFATLPILHAIEDYDLWLRLAALGELSYLGDPLAWYTDTPASSMRGERTRAQEILGVLVILRRQKEQSSDDPAYLSAVDERIEELIGELALLSERRVARRFAAARRARPELKVWFGSQPRPGMLTIGRREEARSHPDAPCNAYVDVGEVWFPERSVALVGTALMDDGGPSAPVAEIGAAARPWLADQGRLVVEIERAGSPSAASLSATLRDAGFELIREARGRIEFGKRR